jgi:hypothetical protein
MPTYSADVLPSTTGLNLGDANHRWNLFAKTIDAQTVTSSIFASKFSGADAGVKIAAAIATLPSTGGQVIALHHSQSVRWQRTWSVF